MFNDDLILTNSFSMKRRKASNKYKEEQRKKSEAVVVPDILDSQLQSYLQYNTLDEQERLQSPRIRAKGSSSRREELGQPRAPHVYDLQFFSS